MAPPGRTRIISFRISDQQHQQLRRLCVEQGFDKISDYARSALLATLEEGMVPEGESHRVQRLANAVEELRAEVERLTTILDRLPGQARGANA